MMIQELTKWQNFTYGAGLATYQFIENKGEIEMPNRNNWGRLEGGSHKAVSIFCRTKRYGVWKYQTIGFPINTFVRLVD